MIPENTKSKALILLLLPYAFGSLVTPMLAPFAIPAFAILRLKSKRIWIATTTLSTLIIGIKSGVYQALMTMPSIPGISNLEITSLTFIISVLVLLHTSKNISNYLVKHSPILKFIQ